MMTAKEHFDWSVERAMEYIERGDAQGAFSSFASDIKKHPETSVRVPAELLGIGMFEILRGPRAVRRWIEEFPSP